MKTSILKLTKLFNFALFNIEYHIEASEDGVEIPLLFYASEYYDDFEVSIDGAPIELLEVRDLFDSINEDKFNDFSNLFESNTDNLDNNSSDVLKLRLPDFLYFKTNISKGKHVIKVKYKATRWTFKDSWVKSYSFRYALSPAKYWKSFGTLDITIDATSFDKPITTNLSDDFEPLEATTKFSYKSLPTDVLLIEYIPEINGFASFLIDLKPFNISILLTIILIILHVFRIKKYRIKHPNKGFSPIVLIGAILIPIAFVGAQLLFHAIIENLIGNNASGLSSYVVLYQIIAVPILIVFYLILMLLVDWFLKRTIAKRQLE